METSKKLMDAYVQRMPLELKAKFTALSAEERVAILKAMMRFHQVMGRRNVPTCIRNNQWVFREKIVYQPQPNPSTDSFLSFQD